MFEKRRGARMYFPEHVTVMVIWTVRDVYKLSKIKILFSTCSRYPNWLKRNSCAWTNSLNPTYSSYGVGSACSTGQSARRRRECPGQGLESQQRQSNWFSSRLWRRLEKREKKKGRGVGVTIFKQRNSNRQFTVPRSPLFLSPPSPGVGVHRYIQTHLWVRHSSTIG